MMAAEQREPQETPRLTIGLPVYNGARFIDRAIASIRAQTMGAFELIIADNASTDETVAICERHAAEDERIRVVGSHGNRGAAWNFNRIVPMARAQYFKWAAHDDMLEPEFFERCLSVLDHEPDVVICYPKGIDVDTGGRPLAAIDSMPYAQGSDPVARVRELLRFDTSCIESFGIVRTEVLRRTDLIGPYTSSDRTLLLQLAIRGAFREVDDRLLLRRQHDHRSVRADARARNVWFDTSRADTFTFPQWRLFAEYYRSVLRSSAGFWARALMAAHVTRWGMAHGQRLTRELAAGGLHVTGRLFVPLSRSLTPHRPTAGRSK